MVTSSESLAWIVSNYDVPARRGAHIRFAGALARITGATGGYLRARMLESCRWAQAGQMVTLHPTWEVEYAPTHARPEAALGADAEEVDRG